MESYASLGRHHCHLRRISQRNLIATSAKRRITGKSRRKKTESNDLESLEELSKALKDVSKTSRRNGKKSESKGKPRGKSVPYRKGFGSSNASGLGILEADIFYEESTKGNNSENLIRDVGNYSDDSDEDQYLAELTDTEYDEIVGKDTSGQDVLEGCDLEVEKILQSVLAEFHFRFDGFQVQAVRHLISGRSVVVCAPTGAGKTAIAEAAASYYLQNGGRVVYTTPLKALSNQKLGEMRARFGENRAGLQTGDASINPGADIVVMTTEILRNILYRTTTGDVNEDTENAIKANDKESEESKETIPTNPIFREKLDGVKLVVLDECHWLGDPSRGSVWEECVINLPRDVQILAMSATIRNPQDLSGWIQSVHGDCDTVVTSFRPVPLQWHYTLSPGEGAIAMLPLLNSHGRSINPHLLQPARRLLAQTTDNEMSGDWGRWDSIAEDKRKPSNSKSGDGKSDKGRKKKTGKNLSMRTLDELINTWITDESGAGDDWHRLPKWKRIPKMEDVVDELRRRSMLPAIWFIFSRKECDESASRLHASGLSLTNFDERMAIAKEIELLQNDQPEAVKPEGVGPLLAGLASHHAGCLPAWKTLVERLFQRNLIKVVFATETLAAGINMPARSVLISALSRRRDEGIATLAHNELLQMAGRAGRRGYDDIGHCVIVQSRWEEATVAYDIIRKGPESLKSQFSTTYGMALNLLYYRSMEDARAFLDRSFLQYLGKAGSDRISNEVQMLKLRAEKIIQNASKRASKMVQPVTETFADDLASENGKNVSNTLGINMSDNWDRYQKLQEIHREEKRAVKFLRRQLAEERGSIADLLLMESGLPRFVGIDSSGSNIDGNMNLMPALAIACYDPKSKELMKLPSLMDAKFFSKTEIPRYICLGADNGIYAVESKHIAGVIGNNDKLLEVLNEDIDSIWVHVSSIRRSAWRDLNSSATMADGSLLTARIAATKLPRSEDLTLLQISEESLKALRDQRTRVSNIKKELDILRADGKIARAWKRYEREAGKAKVLLDKAKSLEKELQGRSNVGWKSFEAIVNVLQAAGAFEQESSMSNTLTNSVSQNVISEVLPESANGNLLVSNESQKGTKIRFTPLGLVARDLRCANELWMAAALSHSSLQAVKPAELAGVISCLVASEAFSRSAVHVAYPPSAGVIETIESMEHLRSEIALLQYQAGLDVPLAVDLRLAGLVEAWASGASWQEITQDCSLDDGDIARLLMRTTDALRQIMHCEHLFSDLRSVARAANRAMNRNPISDLVT